MTLRLDFEGDDPARTVKFRNADIADVPDWSERRSLGEKITEALGHEGAMTATELATHLEEEIGSIRGTLNRLRDDLVIPLGPSTGGSSTRWGLKAREHH